MKRIFTYIYKNAFVLFLLLSLLFMDVYFTYNNPFVGKQMFVQDDFEITQYYHPQDVWEKVLFGNSTVISGYLEEESESEFVNLGIDCGKITDLEAMLKKGHIKVGKSLAIGMNYLTFYDDFDTNPSYIWHKKWYEPIAFFHRDKMYSAIEAVVTRLKNGHPHPFTGYYHYPLEKAVYYGNLSTDELYAKEDIYRENYYNLEDYEFDDNFSALEEVIKYCQKNNIEINLFWMPWNPDAEYPELCERLKTRLDEIAGKYDVSVYDLTSSLESKYFHDTGHIEYENGAIEFTKIFDEMAKEW